uniref:Uncharacterized protein n=1 Tax=Rhizophora mucronata TaxID=61149 RepID=A0A2P2QYQ6_RHIMU
MFSLPTIRYSLIYFLANLYKLGRCSNICGKRLVVDVQVQNSEVKDINELMSLVIM